MKSNKNYIRQGNKYIGYQKNSHFNINSPSDALLNLVSAIALCVLSYHYAKAGSNLEGTFNIPLTEVSLPEHWSAILSFLWLIIYSIFLLSSALRNFFYVRRINSKKFRMEMKSKLSDNVNPPRKIEDFIDAFPYRNDFELVPITQDDKVIKLIFEPFPISTFFLGRTDELKIICDVSAKLVVVSYQVEGANFN